LECQCQPCIKHGQACRPGQGLQQGAARTARQIAAVWTGGGERGPGAASSCAAHAACGAMAGTQRDVLDGARMTTDLTSTALMLQVRLLASSEASLCAPRRS